MCIYYFSGTGNSFYVSRKIIQGLGGGEAIPISRALASGEIMVGGDPLGIVFPVYSHSYPRIVGNFLRKLRPAGEHYLFSVATHNGGPGLANWRLSSELARQGLRLQAGFELLMPGNSVIMKDFTNPPEERARRLRDADALLPSFIDDIAHRRSRGVVNHESLGGRMESSATILARKMYRLPRHFRVDEKCVKCGVCAKVCPSGNISVGDTVRWGPKCHECLACFHWCPRNAVRLGAASTRILQYHHPNVRLEEMFLR